ncbi:GTP--adenosylcobinamide-phosphate guanylyltransferase [Sphingomonas lenta]|uniref:GTP--adenosylcobinamide-phosphate guanylyltransferase n=1 Tax=Sphingomonas lenta TaxID=1141887 RepID=A0A2A2SGI9_9SPHN|nr:GTP--adenosylcobinamide-phosphate guanylyltransferase [Sphingomonas lenta]
MKAVVLAGSRPGAVDPVAAYAGVAHKALIELDGATLLARVVEALRGAGCEAAVSANAPEVVAQAERLGLPVLPTEAGPSASVGRALVELGTPLLVTTADHALLEPEWVRRFVVDVPANADVAVLLARRESIEAALPGTRRTYLRFADGNWSGCNLFLLRTPAAARAIDLWRLVEADRKRPWRIVRRFGLRMLMRYLLGRLTLAAAVARLGELAGVRAAVVESPFGLAAVDVDKPEDLEAVRELTRNPLPLSRGRDSGAAAG